MDDLISRQAAIDALNEVSEHYTEKGREWHPHVNFMTLAIEELPSAQPDLSAYSDRLWKAAYERGKAEAEQRWIPVTERLPEKDGMFLVSISPSSRMEKRVDTDFYSPFGVWQIFGKFVTAWMPLPEPYRKETEDE